MNVLKTTVNYFCERTPDTALFKQNAYCIPKVASAHWQSTTPGKKSLDFENQFTTLSRQFTTFSRQFTTFFAPILPSTYMWVRSAPPYFPAKASCTGQPSQPIFLKAFFSIFGGVAQHAHQKSQKNVKFSLSIFFDFWRRCAARRQKSKKCQVFIKHVFRFLAVVRSTPPKIGNNAKFYGRNVAKFSEKFSEMFLPTNIFKLVNGVFAL